MKTKTVEVFRVHKAGVHINPRDARRVESLGLLRLLVTLVGRAEKEALELIKAGLVINRDGEDQTATVELRLPCPPGRETDARILLDPERPGREKFDQAKRSPDLPSYCNAYRLVEIVEKTPDPPELVFRLMEAYQTADRHGEPIRRVTSIPALNLQRLITSWLKPAALADLPPSTRGGPSQEVAQMVGSHLGLLERGGQSNVGLPTLEEWNPKTYNREYRNALDQIGQTEEPFTVKRRRELWPRRFRDGQPGGNDWASIDPNWEKVKKIPKLVREPIRFVHSDHVVLYLRRWREPVQIGRRKGNRQIRERERCQVYAALPILSGREISPDSPVWDYLDQAGEHRFGWWKDHLDEFSALAAWGEARLSKRSSVLLIPLAFEGSRPRPGEDGAKTISGQHSRLWRVLNAGCHQVCWSSLVEKGERFELHLTTKREVELRPRPNLIGVHIAVIESKVGWCTRLFWSLINPAGRIRQRGKLLVDFLPRNRSWPGRSKRRQQNLKAALRLVDLAEQNQAELAIEAVVGVKKRGQGSATNKVATRFAFSDILALIENRAQDLSEPMRVFQVSGFKLAESVTQTPPGLGDAVAEIGRAIINKVDKKGE